MSTVESGGGAGLRGVVDSVAARFFTADLPPTTPLLGADKYLA